METQTTTLDQRKKEFINMYKDHSELTMFEVAIQSGMGIEVLTQELKSDREFYAEVKELCGLKIKNEIQNSQNKKK